MELRAGKNLLPRQQLVLERPFVPDENQMLTITKRNSLRSPGLQTGEEFAFKVSRERMLSRVALFGEGLLVPEADTADGVRFSAHVYMPDLRAVNTTRRTDELHLVFDPAVIEAVTGLADEDDFKEVAALGVSAVYNASIRNQELPYEEVDVSAQQSACEQGIEVDTLPIMMTMRRM